MAKTFGFAQFSSSFQTGGTPLDNSVEQEESPTPSGGSGVHIVQGPLPDRVIVGLTYRDSPTAWKNEVTPNFLFAWYPKPEWEGPSYYSVLDSVTVIGPKGKYTQKISSSVIFPHVHLRDMPVGVALTRDSMSLAFSGADGAASYTVALIFYRNGRYRFCDFDHEAALSNSAEPEVYARLAEVALAGHARRYSKYFSANTAKGDADWPVE